MTHYFNIIDSNCKDFPAIQRAFGRLIEPVYGDQAAALHKIGTGHDRLCEGLYVDGQLEGMLVYKKQLADGGKSLEIKTLALTHPKNESGKGLGSLLFQRAMTVAAQRQATHLTLTVSSQKPDALAFFQKKGFQITESIKNRYSVGATEHTLSHTLPTHQHQSTHQAAASSSTPSSSSSTSRVIPKKVPAPAPTLSSSSSSSIQHPPAPRITRFERDERAANEGRNRKRDHSQNTHHERSVHARPNTHHDTHRSHQGRFFQPASTHHQCNLKRQYIDFIARGQKTHEGRVDTQYFSNYKVGDIVTWSAGNTEVTTRITSRRKYSSFREMLLDTGYKNMVPDAKSLDHAVQIYNSIPNYEERARRFGVIAMGVEVCEPQLSHTATSTQAAAR